MTSKRKRIVLLIAGLRDSRCRDAIVEALESVRGVLDVDVSLFRARAAVSYNQACTEDGLIQAILRAGYQATVEQVESLSDSKG